MLWGDMGAHAMFGGGTGNDSAYFSLRSQLVTCMPCLLLFASQKGGGSNYQKGKPANRLRELQWRVSVAYGCDVARSLCLRPMEVVATKRRPRFQRTLLEEYPLPLPAADEEDPLDVLRTRVFRWAEDRSQALGDFRSPHGRLKAMSWLASV